MKIKKVEINGFKSFMDLTTLVFDENLSAVVGPNGCGKSNVVDAIKWVLGEQAPRRMRGKSMEDVIFNGSEKYGPSGMSEVTITFINDGRLVPPVYAGNAEIAVSRRLFRSGESEYMINRLPCRLRDVVELFLGTGVGTRSYSIIEQGMVSDIISFKPEERRMFIEEAAGITLYRERKKMALRKMEQTRINLQRIDDVIAEVVRQLNAVQRQAKKAERYRRFSDEARGLERKAAVHKYVSLCGSMAEALEESARIREAEAALAARVASVEAEIEAARASLVDEERDLSTAQAEMFQAETELRENESRVEIARRETESLAGRNAEYAARIDGLQRRVSQAAGEEETEKARARELEEMLGVHRALTAEKESSLANSREVVSALTRRLEDLRSRIVDVLTGVAENRNHALHLADRESELLQRISRSAAEMESLGRSLDEMRKRRETTAARLGSSRQMVLDLGLKEGSLRRSLADLRTQAVNAEAKTLALKEELAHKKSRLASLAELQQKYEGYRQGVRSVMNKKLVDEAAGRDAGVFGLVADIIETDPAYENAVEAALGERLQYVIVRSHEEGVGAVDWLKKSAEGRSTFIPMNLKLFAAGGTSPSGLGIIGSAKDLVSYDPEYDKIVDYLLGDTVLVDSLSNALAIWMVDSRFKTLVTLEGEVIDPRGVVTGGNVEGAESGFLARKREIRELGAAVRDLDADLRLVIESQQKIRSHLAEVEAALENLVSDAHNAKLGTLAVEKELGREEEEIGRTSDRTRVVGFEMEQARRTLEECREEAAHSKSEIERLEAERAALEAETGSAQGELNAARESERSMETELASVRVREAGDEERLRSVTATIERIRREAGSMQGEISALAASITGNTQSLAALKADASGREEKARALVARLAGMKDGLGRRRAAYDGRVVVIRSSEEGLKSAREELNGLRGLSGSLGLRLKEMELQRGHMEETAHEKLDVDLGSMEVGGDAPVPLSGEETERLERLRAAMAEMGEINLLAIREHEELTARREFLSTHRDDLNRSLESLQRAIQKINRTSRERFIQTFGLVDEKFREIFPRLFHGGKAGLNLMDEDDVLESGVDITAQPPGKKLQSIDLLSGGEKALTAIALIFSIFLIKPSPFCLMDEVDAPLDDANIGRFLSMLKDLSRDSQFIIITHNKRTMETAKKLYGVTMEEPGVSKVISMRMKDVEEGAA